MKNQFEVKVALVTGANSGIGRAAGREGASLVSTACASKQAVTGHSLPLDSGRLI